MDELEDMKTICETLVEYDVYTQLRILLWVIHKLSLSQVIVESIGIPTLNSTIKVG